ncbi:PHB depolymerase family esterase [Accumulibacter sp.]|uniref:extracellular catalytic domain type 2 short-chain-length polyhydroxyalkanoate depolymerase n=1 Tax=Accumulibacter sp. TaxID=2053492 RepID=UPI0026398A35|nr:PHB depolymerase family esterase [Accumulibacter sp.]
MTVSRLRRPPATLLALSLACQTVCAAPPLPALAASLDDLTVSGVSSGAYMAVQFEVAHSKLVRGAGVIAGGPYYCAQGSSWRALTSCMSPSFWGELPSVADLRARAEELARTGRIDSLDNLRRHRAWLFSGGNDDKVETSVMDRLADFYGQWLSPTAIRFVKLPDAGHAMISVADPQPNPCSSAHPPFINRCGDLDAAGEMLTHLLGPLRPSTAGGKILSFDQRPFVDGRAVDAGLADEGYAYIPSACRVSACRIHVVFHGCRQSATDIGRRFVDGAGYNAWADNNRLIVLYPQTTPRHGLALGSWKWVNNPLACWDWWGYSGSEYHTRDGQQIKAVRAMIDRLAAPRRPAGD